MKSWLKQFTGSLTLAKVKMFSRNTQGLFFLSNFIYSFVAMFSYWI